ncbi:protein MAK16 [Strigomonas culicis]|nr:protein MAK16 [Strigomonas culicis]|eukprot:EPY35692.1 protein MAK16 [Strigomonas culicis]
MRKRKMMMEPEVKYVSVNKRQEDKLLRREVKAEAAARIELEIEKELLDRLRKGTYDSVINYNKAAFEKLLDEEELQDEELEELEEDEEYPDFVMDEEEDEEEAEVAQNGKEKNSEKVRRRDKLLIEEEVEHEAPKRARREELDW